MTSLFARAAAAALLAAAAGASLSAPAASQQRPAGNPMPEQPQVINLNLLETLITIKAQELAGVFAYIPESNAAPAMAHYLLYNKRALKRFMKKAEKDLKEVGCINEWDRQVFMYLASLHASGVFPEGGTSLDAKTASRVSALTLAPALPLAEMTLRRRQ